MAFNPICPGCGLQWAGNGDCPTCMGRLANLGPNWHIGNRIMCDFIHRGIIPKRVPYEPPPEEFYED